MFQDVRAKELPGSVRQDLRAIYRFYLDDERRARLDAMGPGKRALFVPIWTIRSLLLKLTPNRRLLLAIALVLAMIGSFSFTYHDVRFRIDWSPMPFLILLFVLMLELMDKVTARDEIAVARQVQLALLPSTDPTPPGFALWSYTRPANDVGGDLIDYIESPSPGVLGVALGDVAGKGLGAALLMAKLQASLRATAPGSASLADLGARLNKILCRDGLDNRFATLFYVELPEAGPGPLRYLNAGHNPPLLVRAAGVDLVGTAGRPLGMFQDSTYTDASIEMAPGDLLLVYSDGLVEANNAAEAEFGLDRLRGLAPRLRDLEPKHAGEMLLAEIDRFLGGVRPQDDLSIILVRRIL